MEDMATSSTSIFNTKTFCIVTGASRGIGRAIAVELSKRFAPESQIVLTARTTGGLLETQNEIGKVSTGVLVRLVTSDLANRATLPDTLQEITYQVDSCQYQCALLINNAGTMWDTSRYAHQHNVSDLDDVQDYWLMNVTSFLLLTSHFLNTFPKRDGLRRNLVNVTSLAAVTPFKCFSVYGMSKAARDMLFKVIALEEPDIRVLNYNPGAVDTRMLSEILDCLGDETSKAFLEDVKRQGKLLKPAETASLLAKLLEEDNFKSGVHMDYTGAVQ